MRIAVIGRTRTLLRAAQALEGAGHEIVCVITASAAPEYGAGPTAYRALADAAAVPYSEAGSASTWSTMIETTQPDISISMNYPTLIPQETINLFPLGILNAHGGDLPRYRGNACQSWAILNGEDHIGLCIHRMVGAAVDAGDIIARDRLPIDLRTKIGSVLEWMSDRIPELMMEAVTRLSHDPDYVLEIQSTRPQDILRCYPRTPEDGRIDWSRGSIDIVRLINASGHPYPGAYCFLDGERLTAWDAEVQDDEERFCAIPGQLLSRGPDYVVIACGAGKIRLNMCEMHGVVGPATDFVSSRRTRLT